MTDTRPREYRLWPGHPFPERQALADFAFASQSMQQFLFKDDVDALFQTAPQAAWEVRRDVFIAVWQIQQSTVIIGEEEFEVYLANRSWMTTVYDGLLQLLIGMEDEFPLQFNFYDRVVTIEP